MPKAIKKIFSKLGKAAIKLSPNCSINSKGELLIYGLIGDWWDGLDAFSIVREIEYLDGDVINVRIHSEGGNLQEGLAMYNALKNSEKTIHVYIDGIAYSMGSAIAMAGDTIYIPNNALMMLHKPWAATAGNAIDLRADADELDLFEQSYLQLYADKTGKSKDEIAALIADGKNHFFLGQQAIDYGLADELLAPVQVAAQARFSELDIPKNIYAQLFTKPAAAAAPTQPESPMFKLHKKGGSTLAAKIVGKLNADFKSVDDAINHLEELGITVKAEMLTGKLDVSDVALAAMAAAFNISEEPQSPAPSAAGVVVDPQAAASQAVADERKRAQSVLAIAAQAKIEDKVAQGWVNEGLTVEVAREKALEIVAQRNDQGLPSSGVVRTVPAGGSLRQAVAQALAVRALPGSHKHTDDSKQFHGLSLMALLRDYMEMQGEGVRGKSTNEILAMGLHTTSDFPNLIADVANKVLLDAYKLVQRTFLKVGVKATASDFKARNVIDVGGGSGLEKINEKGEFKRGTITEGKGSYALDTYGKIFGFSRKLIINDDLGGLTRFMSRSGAKAAQLENSVFWALVKSAAQYNGSALYSAGNKTQVSSAATVVLGLPAMKKSLRQQTELDGEVINLTPSILVVNTEREVEAQKELAAVLATSTSGVNVFANSMELVVAAELDGVSNNPFYMFANPMLAPVFEYCYLEGEEEPYMETKNGFDVDGIELKIRHDFAAGVVGGVGVVKNTGA